MECNENSGCFAGVKAFVKYSSTVFTVEELMSEVLRWHSFGLNIFDSWQNMKKDWAEQKSYVWPSP